MDLLKGQQMATNTSPPCCGSLGQLIGQWAAAYLHLKATDTRNCAF